jgi:hypothetical protein
MRVLVVETDAGAADEAVARLEAAGHAVARCHEHGERHAFPCAGLAAGGVCPLRGDGVDVALTVRARPMPTPAALEDGAACALRANVPLVVTGQTVWNPYVQLPDVTVAHDDVVAACEAAARAPLARHGVAALEAMRASLLQSGVDARDVEDTDVTVTRTRAGLHVTLDVPPGAPKAAIALATTRVMSAVRELDRAAPAIDVVTRVPART